MDNVIRNASQNILNFTHYNFGHLLSFIPPSSKVLYRRLEKNLKKKVSLSIGENFLTICKNEGLLPAFTYTNIYN